MPACPRCGEDNPERFRLCGFCGAPLVAAPAPEEVRKTVTVVFCDLVGSTGLGERLDSESLREILDRYFAEMRRVLERHGGTVEKYIGDAVMAVFGLPRIHEDDAMRAVRAATGMQAALARLNGELGRRWGVTLANRIGVNTGEVVAGDAATGQRLVTGDVVNVAARLESSAGPMEVLVGDRTYRLVRDGVEAEPRGALELRGRAEPVSAFRITAMRGLEGYARRQDAPMVGRDAELGVLREALARVERTGRGGAALIVGQAGVGKSRLARELADGTARTARCLQGRCLPYGEGITFWPVAQIAHQAAGIGEDDPPAEARAKLDDLLGGATDVAERVAAAIGLSADSHGLEEIFWAIRRLLEILAVDRPLIAVFDDLHWAEPALLDLLERLPDALEAPVLVVATTRPDLLETRPEWAEDRRGGALLALEPLSEDESARVVANLLGTPDLPPAVQARVTSAAAGNPLYVEQMLSMLTDEGLLRPGSDGGWVVEGDVAALAVPPTIQALLAARLDRLPDEERAVVQRGAVAGQVFSREAVEVLSPDAARPTVGTRLSALTRKQIVVPDPEPSAWEDSFRFQHVLIRDAAYGGLLKRTRAELHEGFADWLEAAAADRALEYEEIIGYHLEQAHRYRLELGPPDERSAATGARAGDRLGAAGRRALARGDTHAAANLLDRAAALVPPGERAGLLPDLGDALMREGELARAGAALDEAAALAAEAGDGRLAARAAVVRLVLRFITGGEGWGAGAVREVDGLLPALQGAGDDLGLARAWNLLASVHGTTCRYAAAEAAADQALVHARRAGDRREIGRSLGAYAQAALYGPMPVPLAIARCESLLAETAGDRRSEALVCCALARLHAQAGNFEEARTLYRRGQALDEELGGGLALAWAAVDVGWVELLAGDLDAADRELRRGYDTLEAMGERAYLSTVAALLAQAAEARGHLDEADRLSRLSEASVAPDDVETQVLWRGTRARTLARRGDHGEAEALAREAVALVAEVDAPALRGAAELDLAAVLAAAGRTDVAEDAAERAAVLFAAKGDVVSRARALDLLGRPAGAAGPRA